MEIAYKIAIMIVPLILSITLHEAAHGYVASKFGDQTARLLGRVTLNPIKHIDLFGTIIIPVIMGIFTNFIFGWAKPVPVNWDNLRHPRRDMALVALAGPGANVFMALCWAAFAKLMLLGFASDPSRAWMFFHYMGQFGIYINILIAILNLIPIPPLDGSRVVSSLLPPHAARLYNKIEPFGIWILLGLLVIGALTVILLPPVQLAAAGLKWLFGIP